jgi:hypothetical protein
MRRARVASGRFLPLSSSSFCLSRREHETTIRLRYAHQEDKGSMRGGTKEKEKIERNDNKRRKEPKNTTSNSASTSHRVITVILFFALVSLSSAPFAPAFGCRRRTTGPAECNSQYGRRSTTKWCSRRGRRQVVSEQRKQGGWSIGGGDQ